MCNISWHLWGWTFQSPHIPQEFELANKVVSASSCPLCRPANCFWSSASQVLHRTLSAFILVCLVFNKPKQQQHITKQLFTHVANVPLKSDLVFLSHLFFNFCHMVSYQTWTPNLSPHPISLFTVVHSGFSPDFPCPVSIDWMTRPSISFLWQ